MEPLLKPHGLTNERDFPVPRLRRSSRKRHQACHDGMIRFHQHHQEGEVMSIIVIGIDLAKNICAVHGVDENGHAVLVKPKIYRV